jgi:hypothetical protein
MKIQTTIASLAMAMLVVSCTKEGPEGPAGPQGPQGNANVRSVTFSVSPGDWSTISGGYAFNWSTSIITEAIVNTGAVLVYAKAENTWQALPATVGGWATLYHYGVGHVQIETTPPTAPSQVTEWKVVAIASSAMITDGGIDIHDYEQVSAYFGLDD